MYGYLGLASRAMVARLNSGLLMTEAGKPKGLACCTLNLKASIHASVVTSTGKYAPSLTRAIRAKYPPVLFCESLKGLSVQGVHRLKRRGLCKGARPVCHFARSRRGDAPPGSGPMIEVPAHRLTLLHLPEQARKGAPGQAPGFLF